MKRADSQLGANPFDVLGLRPGATSVEIERAGQKLLAMAAAGFDEVKVCHTPFGPRPRDADDVRRALDALRDPRRRQLYAWWAELPPAEEVAAVPDPNAPWTDALAALGWERR
ncbi:MAG: hypothetical protein ABMA64_28575 [Myxococcota bacterium]